jgi:hypothetical protein
MDMAVADKVNSDPDSCRPDPVVAGPPKLAWNEEIKNNAK